MAGLGSVTRGGKAVPVGQSASHTALRAQGPGCSPGLLSSRKLIKAVTQVLCLCPICPNKFPYLPITALSCSHLSCNKAGYFHPSWRQLHLRQDCCSPPTIPRNTFSKHKTQGKNGSTFSFPKTFTTGSTQFLPPKEESRSLTGVFSHLEGLALGDVT